MSAIWTRRAWVGFTVLSAVAALGAVKVDWLSGDQLAALTAVASVATAVASWAATSRASDTADQARRTAEAVASIERDRWHAELTPQVDVSITSPTAGSNRYLLRIKLIGPDPLIGLDSVAVVVRDDGLDHSAFLAGGPTQEEVNQQIWAPLHFFPGINGVGEPGRATPQFSLEHGDLRSFDMKRTPRPRWSTSVGPDPFSGPDWPAPNQEKPIRLRIECRSGQHRPWYLHRDVYIDGPFLGTGGPSGVLPSA